VAVGLNENGNSCSLGDHQIVLSIEIVLPTWLDQKRADAAVRASWERYFERLAAHENNHQTIALEAAERINKLMHAAPASASCKALETSVNRAAKQIVENAELAQEQFDATETPFALE
jgi:predicted secreted Zn-dependent protease